MKNDILHEISAGMYILTTKNSGCFVDAVMQVSGGEVPLVAVSVMKQNYTNKIMHEEKNFVISIFGMDSNPQLIKTFGMNSSKDIDKFEGIEVTKINNINIIKDTIGYLYLEKVDTIENETHTLFIGKLIKAERFNKSKLMTYQHYQEHKEDLMRIKTQNGKIAWICQVCGYIYYGDELPEEFNCPKCKMPKSVFNKM